MAVVYLAGRAIDLRGPPSNTLAFAAGLLVAADPLTIADPAFVLTFGATAAILAASPAVRRWHFPRYLLPIPSMLAASIAAEAALFPVGGIVFSRITVAGLFLNFAAIPLMAVAQIAGMALLPAAVVSSYLAAAIGWVAFVGAAGLVRSAELIHLAPVLTWRVASPSWFVVAGYYAGGLIAWTCWPSRFRSSLRRNVCRVACTAAACCGMWIAGEPWAWISSRGDGRLHATFVDVGQGDAALIRFPHGFSMTVDAGGLSAASSFDIGDRVVAPVLRQFGLRHIDVLALTHGDGDHIGGASALLTEFRPRDVWEGIPVPPFQPLQNLRASAALAGSRWTTVQTSDRIAVDDVQVIVRHPDLPDWERQKVRNDDSIVLEILWRDVSIVMTGDIGRDVERAIQPQFSPSRLRIVKVPHHGSLTSSSEAFVRTLSPRVAVVSVGRSNLFGHPAPAVLERYRSVGAEVFRTDQDGAVTVDTDGYFLNVRTFTGRHWRDSDSVPHEDTKSTKQ
jgi:competence protein ComEC